MEHHRQEGGTPRGFRPFLPPQPLRSSVSGYRNQEGWAVPGSHLMQLTQPLGSSSRSSGLHKEASSRWR